ncbi:hypothetical protein [Haemophilus parahaemolyticus]|uniref:hypothetical protein n=1 Tax=Haemophilus parahaemolyticus TaxID=735 RepID=UPI0003019338|nr:hypothetical protein [Haemophilus parahaemolyticus]QRP13129.1 hypothetical protein I6J29_02970 [Haemophilus parahaemolyticus]
MNQSEQQLEQALIAQLSSSGYKTVTIKNEVDLLLNLKKQSGPLKMANILQI